MLQIHCLTLGDFQVNCYVVHEKNSSHCVLIDPGYEPETLLQFLEEHGLTLDTILVTHGHFDHVGAVTALLEATGCRLVMSEKDWEIPQMPCSIWMYPLARRDFDHLTLCRDGEPIFAAGLSFAVTETPGHTEGSVCYRCEDVLFTGDTLFDGSCGRTDLPGGDSHTMRQSLNKLKNISEDLRIFPGHGTCSTLKEQRLFNPYLR